MLPIADLVSFERIMPVTLTRPQLYSVARYLHAIEIKAESGGRRRGEKPPRPSSRPYASRIGRDAPRSIKETG
jgi:hypothetical protein